MPPDTGVAAIMSMLGSLAVVLAMLAGAALLARKLRGGRWMQAAGRQPIRIIASHSLGWQSCLLIIEAEGQKFLIGTGRGGMTAIGRLGSDPAAGFAAVLAAETSETM